MTNKQTNTKTMKAQELNEKRLANSKQKLQAVTDNKNNIINQKAVELMQTIKQYGKDSKLAVNQAYTLISIIAQSRLKKLNAKHYTETVTELKNSIAQTIDRNGNGYKINAIMQEVDSLYKWELDSNGDYKQICTDKNRVAKALDRIRELANDKSSDLIQDCIILLYHYLDKIESLETVTDTYLLDVFPIVKLQSKFYRNGAEKPSHLWQYENTNIVKEISKTVSRYIANERKAVETNISYESIEIETVNELTNETITITKYKKSLTATLETVTDFNGKEVATQTNTETATLFDSIPQKANLSRRESYIFKRHFGNNESILQICDKLELTENQVKYAIDCIKTKIIKANIFSQFNANDRQKTTVVESMQKINCFTVNGEFVATFESIGTASRILSIGKGHISEILKGKRKTAKGYIFKYAVEK